MYPNLFVPAGFTFSIWEVIYILLGLFVVYSLVSAIRNNPEKSKFIERVGLLYPGIILTLRICMGLLFLCIGVQGVRKRLYLP